MKEPRSNTRAQIEALHQEYIRLTRQGVRLDMQRESQWFEFIRRGFGLADLRAMVAHIQRGIREGKRNHGALKFSNLVGQPDFFEEDLALARALARVPKGDPARAAALAASGRGEEARGKGQGARAAGEIIQNMPGVAKDSQWQVGWEAMKKSIGAAAVLLLAAVAGAQSASVTLVWDAPAVGATSLRGQLNITGTITLEFK